MDGVVGEDKGIKSEMLVKVEIVRKGLCNVKRKCEMK